MIIKWRLWHVIMLARPARLCDAIAGVDWPVAMGVRLVELICVRTLRAGRSTECTEWGKGCPIKISSDSQPGALIAFGVSMSRPLAVNQLLVITGC